MYLVFSVVRSGASEWYVQREGLTFRDGTLFERGAALAEPAAAQRLYLGAARPYALGVTRAPAGKFDERPGVAFERRFGQSGLDTDLVLLPAARPFTCSPSAR